MIRGVSQGVSTAQLSGELAIDYSNLFFLRHQIQENAYLHADRTPLEDTETDEMFQNAGQKGILHPNLDDPSRKRVNKKKGMVSITMTNLPSTSKQLRLEVCQRTDKITLEDWVLHTIAPLSVTYTDE